MESYYSLLHESYYNCSVFKRSFRSYDIYMQIFFTFSLFMQYGYQFKKFLILIIKECYFKVIRIYYAAGSMISKKLSFWGAFSVLLFQSFWLWSVIYQDIIVRMKCFNQLDIFYADRHTEKQHESVGYLWKSDETGSWDTTHISAPVLFCSISTKLG